MADDEANTKSSRNSCVGVSILAIIAVFVMFRFTPIYGVYRHLKYYPEAESVANSLKALMTELAELGELDEAGVRRLLGTEAYRHLEAREVEVDLQPNELIWLRANEMFNIGLGDDGRILLMVDGKRPPEY